jgi:hypothetical protein
VTSTVLANFCAEQVEVLAYYTKVSKVFLQVDKVHHLPVYVEGPFVGEQVAILCFVSHFSVSTLFDADSPCPWHIQLHDTNFGP